MLSSQNYVREQGVLRSGEIFASDVDPSILADSATKVYKHSAVGARFFMPDGASLIFLGGVFITNNPDLIKELDKVADKPGTQITTDKIALERLRREVALAAEDAARPAAEGNVITDTRTGEKTVDGKELKKSAI